MSNGAKTSTHMGRVIPGGVGPAIVNALCVVSKPLLVVDP